MGFPYEHCLLLILILHISHGSEISTNEEWGENCPDECICDITSSSQTLMSRWKNENIKIKAAFCIVTNNSINAILQLPHDTEAFTCMQATDGIEMLIPGKLLKNLTKLISIDLKGSLSNMTTHITNDVFHHSSKLKYLSLERINLNDAEKAFSKLTSLEDLYVIQCTVNYLKWEMLDGLKNLKELYFVESGIKELYGFAFYGTPELRRLFLSHNDLFSVGADAFVGLLKLEYLDLSNNRIDHLSGLTFPPLPHLQWLELKHNPIKVIFPHCFQFLNGTQHLTLGHKQQPVHLMKFSFRGLYSLIFLHIPNIDNDALSEHMFYDLRSLRHLNLQGRVKVINNRAFNGAHKQLRKLILHDCKLEKVYLESFYGLENLHYLDLSHNLLHSLPGDVFQHFKNLRYLLLQNNNLKSLADMTFTPMPNLQVIRLYDNPWNCSCKMQYWDEEIIMAEYSEKYELCGGKMNCTEYESMDNAEENFEPKCEYPVAVMGKSVFDFIPTVSCK